MLPHQSLRLSRISTLHMQIFIPVQDPGHSHANPYACPGSQQFKQLLTLGQATDNSKTSLGLSRLPTLHTQILMLVQVPNNSNNSLNQCRLPILHKKILMPVQAPNNSNNQLFQFRLPIVHIGKEMTHKSPSDCSHAGSPQFFTVKISYGLEQWKQIM
ncbi:hypothetical protein O181_014056 [Austropuccinia psidii MF-1]|uniref:Uncharacterized protein n=1 Tax=Austropuccinia psidii MF-1 TaxID=1389203 RepID=A0A9Q3GNT5_9BASI|nr:hypothetical protein [Austropuccinia psidii MF-1]